MHTRSNTARTFFFEAMICAVAMALGGCAPLPDDQAQAELRARRDGATATDGGVVHDCPFGETLCPSTGRCYDPRCLACCMPTPPPPPPPTPDGGVACPAGEVLCASTGRCYDPRCLACCMPTPPPPTPDAGVVCPTGEVFCASTGRCYDPRCLACCMPTPPPPPPPDGGVVCPTGEVFCASTGHCYDPRCLACCMPTPPPPTTGCAVDTDCGSGQVCVYATAGCGVRGECRTNFACGRVSLPYCGCDGTTFFDTCAGPTHPWLASGACPTSH